MNKRVNKAALFLTLGLFLVGTAGATILLKGVGGPRGAAAAPPAGDFSTNSCAFNNTTSDFLSMADSTVGVITTNYFSIVLWVRNDDVASVPQGFVGKYGFGGQRQFYLWAENNGSCTWKVSDTGGTSLGVLTTNATDYDDGATGGFRCIIAIWDSSNATEDDRIRLETNGVAVTSFATRTNPTQHAGMVKVNYPLKIGDRTSGNYLNGFADEFAIFTNRAVTYADVSSGGKPKDLSGMAGLIIWHRLGENGLTTDEVKGAGAWTTNGAPTVSTTVP